ncbi:MAG: PIN domain-containing protein [Halobacteriota archaeon]
MTFLDSSVIIDLLQGVPQVVDEVERRGQPYLTSSLCVYEVIDGKLGVGDTDVTEVRQQFGGVQAIDLNEQIALEAARMQDALMNDGERMPVRDLLIAATSRSTGAELLVSDADFQTNHLSELMKVTHLDEA